MTAIVVGYVRGSRGALSMEDQESMVRRYAEAHDLGLVEIYKDGPLDGPGTGSTRSGLIALLDSMVGSWEAVLVSSMDRLADASRNTDVLGELEEAKKCVLVVETFASRRKREVEAEPVLSRSLSHVEARARERRPRARPARATNPVSPPPEVSPEVLALRAAKARALYEGRVRAAQNGNHISGPVPYGYRRVGRPARLVEHAREADVVRRIFRDYLKLRSIEKVIRGLVNDGIYTRRGKLWSRAGVSWILKNDTYRGRVHFAGVHVKGNHVSLVSAIVFNKAQVLLRRNDKKTGRYSCGKHATRRHVNP